MKRFISLILLVTGLNSFAQNEDDALRYSFLTPMGTARYSAMGGGFSALGADLSLAAQNPAGLAVYRTNSVFTITPSFCFNSTNSSYLDNKLNDFSYGLQFNNIGVVLTFGSDDKKEGWVNTNLAVTYNRLADFRNDIYAEGINNTSSLSDYFVQMANGNSPNELYEFEEGIAFDTYLIDTVPGMTNTYKNVYNGTYGEQQTYSEFTRGGLGEINIAFAGNYENKLFLGGSFNVQNIKYSHEKSIVENDINDSVPNFENFIFTDKLNTTGSGFNLKIGMLYKINRMFSIGLGVHTPTFFSMKDEYKTFLTNVFDTAKYDFSSSKSIYDYNLITPARFLGSLGIVFSQNGALSLEFEGVNYGSARLRSKDYKFVTENSNIENLYTWGLNVRGGVEYNIGMVAVRAGAGYYSSPYKSDKSRYVMNYNGGIRVRGESLYVDFTYTLMQKNIKIYPYKLTDKPVSAINANQYLNYFTTTVGIRF
jgi:hypothetical protein